MLLPRQLRPMPRDLLARDGNDPSNSYQGHSANDIAQAIADHASKMSAIDKELLASTTTPSSYQGHDSADIAKAIQSYVAQHQDDKWSAKFVQPSTLSSSNFKSSAVESSLSSAVQYAAIDVDPSVFSLAAHAQSHQFSQIILCIIWISTGLLLVFFGWSAYFWGANLSAAPKRIDEKAPKKGKSRSSSILCSGPPLAGGVGGLVVGFLFFSFLATVITSAICVSRAKTVSSISYFIIWLVPGLMGALLAGHWALFARAFTGLLAGGCLTVILTAMFGIHTLIIRVIIVSIFTSLITAPLLIPNRTAIHFPLLNMCTSIIGMVTFLDGVALYAPPQASSASWIDLWIVLFAMDESSSEVSATKKWGTSAFKGYIAGAVLGAVVGFLFEFIFHKHASEDPEQEWNNYLGSYTQHLGGKDPLADLQDRAGSFEPAPTPLERIAGLFAPKKRPATYGNVPTGHGSDHSPLTELPTSKAQRARRSRSRKSRGSPAKFEALSRHDRDLEGAESDSDATEYDSDSSLHKLAPGKKALAKSSKSLYSQNEDDTHEEEEDLVGPLYRSDDSKAENYRGYALPRPPSYRTNSSNSHGSSRDSRLTGTTVNSNGAKSNVSVRSGVSAGSGAEKSIDVYRDGDAAGLGSPTRPSALSRSTTLSPPPSFHTSVDSTASPLPTSVPATPSLINAITRIQAAQAQARAWHDSRQQDSRCDSEVSPYDKEPSSASPPSQTKTLTTSAAEEFKAAAGAIEREGAFSPNAHNNSKSPASPHVSNSRDGPGFQTWWKKEVKGDRPQ